MVVLKGSVVPCVVPVVAVVPVVLLAVVVAVAVLPQNCRSVVGPACLFGVVVVMAVTEVVPNHRHRLHRWLVTGAPACLLVEVDTVSASVVLVVLGILAPVAVMLVASVFVAVGVLVLAAAAAAALVVVVVVVAVEVLSLAPAAGWDPVGNDWATAAWPATDCDTVPERQCEAFAAKQLRYDMTG